MSHYRMERGWMDDPLFNERFTRAQAWEWLISEANWRDTRYARRGTLRVTVRQLADRWKWSVEPVSRFLRVLRERGQIQTDSKHRFTVLTIVNYDKYQAPVEDAKQNPNATQTQPKRNPNTTEEDKKEEYISPPSTRARRLPEDWVLPSDWEQWARKERPDIDVREEAAKFRDYWIAKAGKDACKRDWLATWRNWVRRANAKTRRVNPNRVEESRESIARWLEGHGDIEPQETHSRDGPEVSFH